MGEAERNDDMGLLQFQVTFMLFYFWLGFCCYNFLIELIIFVLEMMKGTATGHEVGRSNHRTCFPYFFWPPFSRTKSSVSSSNDLSIVITSHCDDIYACRALMAFAFRNDGAW